MRECMLGSGIGLDCARSYAAEGALGVVFADLNLDAAQAGAESSKAIATNPEYRALALAVDVADVKSVEGMVTKTVATFGRVDYSVNSAGVRLYFYPPLSQLRTPTKETILHTPLNIVRLL